MIVLYRLLFPLKKETAQRRTGWSCYWASVCFGQRPTSAIQWWNSWHKRGYWSSSGLPCSWKYLLWYYSFWKSRQSVSVLNLNLWIGSCFCAVFFQYSLLGLYVETKWNWSVLCHQSRSKHLGMLISLSS